ncbi:hypothetical protein Tco_0261692 [Tanacetum coccineum]
MDVELLDLYDRCYARQNVVDNAVNKRSRKLLEVIEKLRGECDVIKEKERAQEKESESLRVKCEAAMSDFEKNPTVFALREKISTLSTKVKEHKANLERMMLESQKWAVEVSLRKEVDDVKRDMMEVVLKVIPYASMKLIHSDDLGSLVDRLVSSAIFYGRCKTFEQVAAMKEPFDLSKVKSYRPLYKKEHDQAGNDLATTTFPLLSEFVADSSAPVKVLLSKKPFSLQRPAPLRTQALVASSMKATTSFVLVSNLMSPPADASIVKPFSSQAFSDRCLLGCVGSISIRPAPEPSKLAAPSV